MSGRDVWHLQGAQGCLPLPPSSSAWQLSDRKGRRPEGLELSPGPVPWTCLTPPACSSQLNEHGWTCFTLPVATHTYVGHDIFQHGLSTTLTLQDANHVAGTVCCHLLCLLQRSQHLAHRCSGSLCGRVGGNLRIFGGHPFGDVALSQGQFCLPEASTLYRS